MEFKNINFAYLLTNYTYYNNNIYLYWNWSKKENTIVFFGKKIVNPNKTLL